MHSSELLKGTLKTILLKLLAENGKMYGYEITQAIKELTKGEIEITEGSLYPALHGLLADKLLKTELMHIGKRVRKYYMLTKEGKAEKKKRIDELSEFMNMIKQLLDLKLFTK